RAIRSRCPLVGGSNDPGYMAMTFLNDLLRQGSAQVTEDSMRRRKWMAIILWPRRRPALAAHICRWPKVQVIMPGGYPALGDSTMVVVRNLSPGVPGTSLDS